MRDYEVDEARERYLKEKDPKEKARLKRVWRGLKRKLNEGCEEGRKR